MSSSSADVGFSFGEKQKKQLEGNLNKGLAVLREICCIKSRLFPMDIDDE